MPKITLKRALATLLVLPFAWFVVAVIAATIHTFVFTSNDFGTPQNVARMLKLHEAPRSMRHLLCYSWAITDVDAYCAFDIDPEDFPALLKGWPFIESRARGGSYQYASPAHENLGPGFEVAVRYEFRPSEFKHGGRVLLVANAQRTRALVNYFEE